MRSLPAITLTAALAFAPILHAHAAFTTIDISSIENNNITTNPSTIPVGTTTGNQNTGIPFDITAYGTKGYAGLWIAKGQSSPGTSSTLNYNLTSQNISGEASFYALLNNFYGTAGANEYNITITATNGDSVTYQSIGGVNTRDYNQNASTTSSISDTTTPWFNNGLGQRLDVREFDLPSSFATETLATFQITQINAKDPALLSGLTFSTQAATFAVPEPASIAVLGLGLVSLTWSRRRRYSSPAA